MTKLPSEKVGFKYSVGQTLKLKPRDTYCSLECANGSGCWMFMPETPIAGIISSIMPNIKVVILDGDEVIIPLALLEELS